MPGEGNRMGGDQMEGMAESMVEMMISDGEVCITEEKKEVKYIKVKAVEGIIHYLQVDLSGSESCSSGYCSTEVQQCAGGYNY